MQSSVCQICSRNDWQLLFKTEGFAINRCKHCNIIATTVQEDKKTSYSEDYYWNMKTIDPISKRRYENLLNKIRLYKKSGRLLDIGCGVGHFLYVARENQWFVTGVEISEDACKIGRENFGLSILLGELPALSLKTESFDVVVMWEAIEHLEKPSLYLKEICRLLRRGGLLIISTPNFNSLSRFLLGFAWRIVSPEHYHLFTAKTIKGALLRNGFFVKNIQAKNIDINEIIQKRLLKKYTNGTDRYYGEKDLREKIEGSVLLLSIKAFINAILNVTKLGDSLWVFAEKR